MTKPTPSNSPTRPNSGEASHFPHREFIQKIIIAAVFALFFFVLWQGLEVLLLVFAGLLLAVFLRGMSDFLSRHTALSEKRALAVVLLAIIAAVALCVWLLAPGFARQFGELSETLPRAASEFGEKFGQPALVQEIKDGWSLLTLSDKALSNLPGRIAGVFSSALGALINLLIVIATGIYFAVSPKMYYEGALKLLPEKMRGRADEVFDALNFTLRRWIIGRIGVMAINGALTTVGLQLLGVPLAIPLGMIAGAFNFVPNIGPLAAALPAVVIAFTLSPAHAVYTSVLYLAIQNIDGFVITPLVQQKTVALPAVVVIASQLLFGILFGVLGLLLAVPLVAVLFVLVKMLYVEDYLGEQIEIEAEDETRQSEPTQ